MGKNENRSRRVPPDALAVTAAQEAGLRYVSDRAPGVSRERVGRTFRYRDASGKSVIDSPTLSRIRHLAIPPAWTHVWICPIAHGHIQATGRDARGRKQYRYHPHWRAARDETKYERILAFACSLPAIRARVTRDLRRPNLDRVKVLATMVRLLEVTLIRIGNEEYARHNHSFGLSTMRDRHVSIGRGTLHFEFRGKSGKKHEVDLHDPRLAAIVRRVQDLPGQELFQYLDEDGRPQKISSEDVNAYLREIAGDDFSAKDFRTWAGTVLAAIALRQSAACTTKAQAKHNLAQAVAQVAQRLGNTPTVCRNCYIHPAVMDAYLGGVTVDLLPAKGKRSPRGAGSRLRAEERAVLAFLKKQLNKTVSLGLTDALQRSIDKVRHPRAA
jgi:DNA topoisomerase I